MWWGCWPAVGTSASRAGGRGHVCSCHPTRLLGAAAGPCLPPRTHLCQGSDAVVHVGQDGRLVAHLEVEVDDFVGEGGELVAEAEGVDTLDLGVVREAVVLLLGLLVDGLAVGVLHVAVHIIVPSADHLCRETHPRWWHVPSDVARAPAPAQPHSCVRGQRAPCPWDGAQARGALGKVCATVPAIQLGCPRLRWGPGDRDSPHDTGQRRPRLMWAHPRPGSQVGTAGHGSGLGNNS